MPDLAPTTAVAVLAHVAEGIGIRKTARLTGVHKDTVARYTRLTGDHAAALHDELVAISPGNSRGPVRREVVFVGKKQKNCEPDVARCGDCWDHVALDPETRLVVSLVVGKRTADATRALFRDFRRRTRNRVLRLMTPDEYPVYADVIRDAYGQRVIPPRTGRRGCPRQSYTVIPPGVTYATIHKEKENTRVMLGTAAVTQAVAASAVGRVVNTSFVERHNGTDRNRCSRKVRKTYAFSKDWDLHRAATRFSYLSYNFCWPVRTLRVRGEHGRWQKRTPAMAAGLTDHVWSVSEWVTYPVRHVQRE